MFPVDDLDKIIPSWFKFWSGQRKNEAGHIIDGTLMCIGDGPGVDAQGNEVPGTATWRDRRREPPKDEIITARDPATGLIKRRCWGTKCVDAGNCKQNMQVFCILPLVSPVDIYRIDTSSWRSMRSFFNTLNQCQMLGGRIAGRPYRVIKKEVPVPFWDKEKQQEFKSMKPLVFLEEWDHVEFLQLHGKQVASLQEQLAAGKINLRLPTAEEAALLPSPELYPTEPFSQAGEQKAAQAEVVQGKVDGAKALLTDPEVKAAIDEFEHYLGTKIGDKDRMMRIRKFESEPDPKAAVLAAVRGATTDLKARAAKPAAQAPLPPGWQDNSPPPNEAPPPPEAEAAPPQTPLAATKAAKPRAQPQRVAPNPNTPPPDADGII
jgi:Recombination directionality factor-like